MILALKLTLTPLFIGLVSLAGRRWGPALSGWLVGLPLTSGPIALFLALDQGTLFAARAAQGTLIGLISVACFALAYSWVAQRFGWFYSMLAGWAAFFLVTIALTYVAVPLIVAFVGVIVFLAITLVLLPKSKNASEAMKSPSWEPLIRMVVATAFVVMLTAVAGILGPQLSGLLSPFPTFVTVLAVFTHRFQGAPAACRLIRGTMTGLFSFAVFFLIIASTIAMWGIAVAFVLATLAALAIHSGSLLFLHKRLAQA